MTALCFPFFSSPPGFYVAIVHEQERSLKAPEADLGAQTLAPLPLGTLSARQNNNSTCASFVARPHLGQTAEPPSPRSRLYLLDDSESTHWAMRELLAWSKTESRGWARRP